MCYTCGSRSTSAGATTERRKHVEGPQVGERENAIYSGRFSAAENASRDRIWQVLVQDRLTGDPAVVTKIELEVIAEVPATGSGS